MEETSEFVRHIPCPQCGSSDANALYSDGHEWCHKRCGYYKHADGQETTTHIHTNTLKHAVHLQGSAERLQKRKLSEKVCQKYKIYRDGQILRFYYHTRDGLLKGCKVKTKSKDFSYEGETPGTLFGQHLFPSSGKRIVITEGELDAASCYEVQPGWATVSLPNGAAGAKKAIQRNLDFLQGYEKIILFFDNDLPGQEAAKEAAGVLPPGKAFIAVLEDYKDASEALQAGKTDLIQAAMNYAHEEYRPDGIVDAKTLLDLVTTPQPPSDYDYPYQGLQSKLHGIRLGELTTITAGSGQGKSSVCRDLAAYLLSLGIPVGYLALEESNRRTALGLMSAAVGKNLSLGEHSHDELTEAFDSSINNWNLYLFDGFGSFDPDIIYNRIEYLASGLDCKVIFLDHLSILMSGLDGDERRMIDQTMTRLRSLVERTGIALFLVSHLKRGSTDSGHEEGQRVSLSQLRGSASIAQLSDSVIALERDQQSNSGASETTVRIIKNRYSGETGVACSLKYNLETCTFNETKAEKEFDPSTDF
jgi:twinkle protein